MKIKLTSRQYAHLIGEAYRINPELVTDIFDKYHTRPAYNPGCQRTKSEWSDHEWFWQYAVDHISA